MKNIIRKYGVTRTVYLIGKYAIKFPTCNNWEHFLLGLLGNLNERSWSKINKKDIQPDAEGELCPVLFCCWGGWFLIMPRCEELTSNEFDSLDCEKFTGSKKIKIYSDPDMWMTSGGLPVEHKLSSFGKLNGKIVALDYGS